MEFEASEDGKVSSHCSTYLLSWMRGSGIVFSLRFFFVLPIHIWRLVLPIECLCALGRTPSSLRLSTTFWTKAFLRSLKVSMLFSTRSVG